MIKVINLKKIMRMLILIIIFLIFLVIMFDKNETVSTSSDIKGKYKILVDVEESKLYLFENDVLVNTYKCSGGKWSTPSPIGTWSIVSKAKWGEGFRAEVGWDLMFHGDNLEYMEIKISQQLGGQAHIGCIRMDNDDVAELYNIISIGTKVTIIDGPYGTFGKGFRNLKSGMYGSDVLEIQKKLKELGFFESVPNGKFGSETENAVQKYCIENGLYVRKTIDVELQNHMGFELMD